MKKKILIILTASILNNSCIAQKSAKSPMSTEPFLPSVSVPAHHPVATSEPVPLPPKINNIDWQSILLPLVQKMLAAEGISNDTLLLVNNMKNDTNGNIQTSQATVALTSMIADYGGKFQVVSYDQLNVARQTLGLSMEDNLESRSKAVGLARYLNAQYVLYSAATGDARKPTFDLQLILVKNGEIIWSGKWCS